jgi:uncharacterized lipoprotein YmbA
MNRGIWVVVLAAGCFAAHPDPTRFYVLTPMASEEGVAPAAASTPVVLGLGPITLPRYLDRSELVYRVGANEVRPAGFDRWAEPLHLQIARTLAEDLTVLGVVTRVVHHPWYRSRNQDIVLELDVQRFERDTANQAVIEARWRLRCPGAPGVLHGDDATLVDPAVTTDAAATAEALSRQLAELSRRIAATIQAQPRARCADDAPRTDGKRRGRMP